MKKNSILLGCLMLLATIVSGVEKNDKEVVLLEAGKSTSKTLYCSTCSWIKGSDFAPKTELVDFQNAKWLKFNYTGKSGTGRAVIVIKDKLKKLPETVTPRGVTLEIYYPDSDFKKLPVSVNFANGNSVVKYLALEKGVHKYYFDTGWSRKKIIPQDWRGLSTIVLSMSVGTAPNFLLRKISIKLHPKQTTTKNLKILKVRTVQEILPGKGAVSLKFNRQSPLKVKVGYDADNLYVDSYAKYPGKPSASFKPGDKVGSIWGDELTEFFFDGWNDNRCSIQFVTNMNGAVWDAMTAFDRTAAMVIRRDKDWQLTHQKKNSFSGNVWKNELALPLKSIHVDLKRQFMGFQIAQGYEKKRGGKFKTTVWAPCKRFPYPRNFGLLVFNKKPFGSGTIRITDVVADKDTASGNTDFIITCQLNGFRSGEYTLKKYLSAPDNTFQQLDSQTIKLSGKTVEQKITLSHIKGLDGLYTFYLGLVNKSGDMRLSAINVENVVALQDLFGQRLFSPTPKQIKWGKGLFYTGKHNIISVPKNTTARMLLTAKIFKQKLLGFTGIKYRIVQGGTTGIVLNIDDTVVPAKVKKNLRKESYKLLVTPQKVTITGGGEAGLYYGCKTFMQLIKQPMKRTVESPVPAVEIVDYPDLPIRFVNLLHPWQFYKGAFKERRSIDYLINWVDRYVAGSKLNVFICNIDSLVEYKRHPEFNAANCLYSLDDLAKLAKYCRDNFIEFVPRWQIGGHASWWLLRVHPEMKEKDYKNQADITHPEHNKLVFDCFLDIIEATQCKYINVGGDEWWHSPEKGRKPAKYLMNGKTRAEAFLEFFQAASKFGRQHNVKILTHEDMINPRHNGTRYDLYKITDKLPKDLIILPWASKDIGIKYFNKLGFTQWVNPTGVWFPKNIVPLIDGYGCSVYSFFWSLPITGPKVVVGYITNLLRGAEFAWNANSDNGESITMLISSGKLPALINMYAESANPKAAVKVYPIDLKTVYNRNFNALCSKVLSGVEIVNMPNGKQNIGNITMQLTATGKNCILIKQNAKITIPVSGKYSSLIFLHSVLTTDKFLKANYRKLLWRHWIYGRPAGDYQVVYQDGTKVKLPLRMHDNIWKTAVNPRFRMSIGCRYVLPLKASDGNNLFLYQWEWVNPHPDKQITGIELTQSIVDFDLVLFAVSGREVVGN
ncbi:MAG: family 20 glycosylhydrolase [Victivallaceae bacterium]|nr:family 20 glycosylhydrolase [Victivallaceae bacterium]